MASGNKNKIKEMAAILESFGMDVISKDDAGFGHIDPEEDGETYEENSLKKAMEIMEASGLPVIADDSGLEVEYLSGAPGIHSARFAGDDCNYDRNNEKMLMLLDGVPEEKRRAKFVTVITMVFPGASSEPTVGDSHAIEKTDSVASEATASAESDTTVPAVDQRVIVARGECPGRIITELRGSEGFGYDPIFIPDGYEETFAQLGSAVKNKISHRARALNNLKEKLNEI